MPEHLLAQHIHKGRYIQSSDPGEVGAGVEWLDTSTTPPTHKKRNVTDDGWDTVLPGAHKTSHQAGGDDAIKLDDLAAPDDNTDLDVSTTAHGLAPKAPNDATRFLDGAGAYSRPAFWFHFAASDETTALTTGTAKITFRLPACTVLAVRASVNTAPTGADLVVDINEGGSTILSTKLSIDAGEKTSTTAASAAVISDANIADDAEITVDIDQVGSTVAGAGLKIAMHLRPA